MGRIEHPDAGKVSRRGLLASAVVASGVVAFLPKELLADHKGPPRVKNPKKISLDLFHHHHHMPRLRAALFLLELGMDPKLLDKVQAAQMRMKATSIPDDKDIVATCVGGNDFKKLCKENQYQFWAASSHTFAGCKSRTVGEIWFACMLNFRDNTDCLGFLNGEYF